MNEKPSWLRILLASTRDELRRAGRHDHHGPHPCPVCVAARESTKEQTP